MTYFQRHSNRQETFIISMIRSFKTCKIPKAEPNPWSYGNTLIAFLCFLRHRIELDGSLDLLISAYLSQQQLRNLQWSKCVCVCDAVYSVRNFLILWVQMLPPSSVLQTAVNFIPDYTSHTKGEFYFLNTNWLLGYISNVLSCGDIEASSDLQGWSWMTVWIFRFQQWSQ
jgi:hypothetical protein